MTGVQRGVTIRVFNYARTLHGVQLGVINLARNNATRFQIIPVLNPHFAR